MPADKLIRALERLGYVVIRKKGSHVRLRHEGPPVHLVTVPLHDALLFALWSWSFLGCEVSWRQERFGVDRDGSLRRVHG